MATSEEDGKEPTLQDVLQAVGELPTEMRSGLAEMRGRLDGVDGRLDRLTKEVETLGHDVRRQLTELDGLPEKIAAAVEKTTASEIRQLNPDVAQLQRAAGQ